MCFSIQVDKDIKKLAKMFTANPMAAEFQYLKQMQAYESSLKPEELKSILGLKRKPTKNVFNSPGDDGIVYPNYFAPIITTHKTDKVIRPMRYRVRSGGSTEEIPSKYNVFNARLDSLEKRATWKNIFMKNHGIVPFRRFFEWVEDEDKNKRLISFSPKNREIMWAPCLFDFWESKDEKIKFFSFAIITQNPPQEVQVMGHDRCPIFLKENEIENWLSPSKSNKESIYKSLGVTEEAYFDYQWENSL